MSTAACSAMTFVIGALARWEPQFIMLGHATQDKARKHKLIQEEYDRKYNLKY